MKLKGIQFETAIIERYKRRECSVEEALIEMYLAGVSVQLRKSEDAAWVGWYAPEAEVQWCVAGGIENGGVELIDDDGLYRITQ